LGIQLCRLLKRPSGFVVVEGEYQRESLIEETLSLRTFRRDDVMMLA
jgi:hypothetical protein